MNTMKSALTHQPIVNVYPSGNILVHNDKVIAVKGLVELTVK